MELYVIMTFGSLFAGIGGIDLGFERAGLACRWQVENHPYARAVLEKHWPNVRRHDDVRTFPPSDPDEWRVDIIAGGFPCQDISIAGKKAGIKGERSGLWAAHSKVLRALRPAVALVENVPALTLWGMDRVLGDLAELGYDAEWARLPAAAFGAPHLRRRIYIVAYSHRVRCAPNPGRARIFGEVLSQKQTLHAERFQHSRRDSRGRLWPAPDPSVYGVDDGVSGRLDEYRIECLGNAVYPDVAEAIAVRILEAFGP